MAQSSVENVSKSIDKLLELMDHNQLVLPEIQRDFVWTKKAIQLLMDSLYRGLPIGHMLIWKAKNAVDQRAFDKQKLTRGAYLEGFYGYLLDGQQRLTALMHLRDGDEEYPLMFYVWPEREKDGDETFYWRGKNEADDPWCIPVSEVLQNSFSVTGRLNAIKVDRNFNPAHEEMIRRDLASLEAIKSYKIGITEFETADYELATELFIRFNSTGRKLRRSDLSIAELALHVPGLASKKIRAAQTRWKDFRFTMPFLVQCLLAVHTGRFRISDPKQFWANVKPAELEKSWERAERGIAKLIEFLTGTVRWNSEAQVPSFLALIPLIVILSNGNAWSIEDRRLARSWLLLTCVHGYFSGSVETRLDKVLRDLAGKMTVKQLWAVTQRRLRKLKVEDFETGRLSGAIMSLFLSMQRDTNAKDWLNTDFPLDGSVVGHGAPLQVHHFFPRALLNKQRDLKFVDINTFANYAILSAATNLNVSTEEPATYLERLHVSDSELEKQCIPTDRSLWQVRRYKDFLVQRRKLLVERANTFLGR